MKTIEERQAEKWLPLLLDDVERGEAITIVRGDKAIAELRPVSNESVGAEEGTAWERPSPFQVRAAMQSIRERAHATENVFDLQEFKAWRNEGRP